GVRVANRRRIFWIPTGTSAWRVVLSAISQIVVERGARGGGSAPEPDERLDIVCQHLVALLGVDEDAEASLAVDPVEECRVGDRGVPLMAADWFGVDAVVRE